MDALIFDFDGVILDSEPIHLAGFQRVLETMGVELTRQEYYDKYLGFDDYQALSTALRDHRASFTESDVQRLIASKTALVQKALGEFSTPLPGVWDLVASAHVAGIGLAVCSGALRQEIELACRAVGILDRLQAVVSAEDVEDSKPDPACYKLTVQRLAKATARPIRAERCVAFEDSPFGIAAAQGAGLKVVGITSSYGAEDLAAADRVVESLEELTLQDLRELL